MIIFFERNLRNFVGVAVSTVDRPIESHIRQCHVIDNRKWVIALALLMLSTMAQLARGSEVVGCVEAYPATEIEAALLDSNGREVFSTHVRDDNCFGIQGISPGTYYIQLRGQFIETGTQQFGIDSTGTDLGLLKPTLTIPATVALLSTVASASPDAFPQLVATVPDSPYFTNVLNCMDGFGHLAAQQFQSMPSANSVRDRMFDIGSRAGVPPEISGRAASDASSSYGQPAMFAFSIAELGASIRAMRDGDLGPYHRSMTYQNAALANQALNLYRSMGFTNELGFDFEAFLNQVRLAGFVFTHDFVATFCH